MAQDSIHIQRYTCDRCKVTEDNPSASDWAKLKGQIGGGRALVPRYEADLCRDCADAFVKWFEAKSA